MAHSSSRIFGLDVVRSLAILCVLGCHWTISAMSGRDAALANAIADCLGTFGVELFFVLSGYLIGGILIRDVGDRGMTPGTILNFWQRRWFRTLPNYYVYLIIAVVLARPWKLKMDGNVVLYPFFLQNLGWPMGRFFVVSWSLAIEEWFYLSFPLLIAIMGRFMPSPRRAVLASILTFLGVPLLLRLAWNGHNDLAVIHEVVIYRLDAIALGVGLAFVKRYHPSNWRLLCSAK